MSAVLSTGLVTPEVAAAFFAAQLACRTDAADLASDLAAGVAGIRVIDTPRVPTIRRATFRARIRCRTGR